MSKTARVLILVLALCLFLVPAAAAAKPAVPPGQEPDFAKGVTTSVTVTTQLATDIYTENLGAEYAFRGGKVQYRDLLAIHTVVKKIVTTTTLQHHGAPGSGGELISTDVEVTTEVVSDSVTGSATSAWAEA